MLWVFEKIRNAQTHTYKHIQSWLLHTMNVQRMFYGWMCACVKEEDKQRKAITKFVCFNISFSKKNVFIFDSINWISPNMFELDLFRSFSCCERKFHLKCVFPHQLSVCVARGEFFERPTKNMAKFSCKNSVGIFFLFLRFVCHQWCMVYDMNMKQNLIHFSHQHVYAQRDYTNYACKYGQKFYVPRE